MKFLDTDFLNDGEIYLRLVRTSEGNEARKFVPAYHFAICNQQGIEMGTCDLRVGYNTNTYYGGNIGYTVNEPFRGHRYAAKACKLLFELAKRHGMKYVIVTCNPTNVASRRTCELAGCEFVEIVELPQDNDMRVERGETEECIYRIDF